MRVMIVGMGALGRELAAQLLREDGRHEVVCVDSDAAVCDELAAELDALVIHGDGTHPAVLEQAQIARAQAVVACTSSDALNVVVAMLAKRYAVPAIVVRLTDLALRPACLQVGVTRIVTPSVAGAAEIRDVLAGEGGVDLSVVARGGMRVIEVDGRPAAGTRLADLALPPGALVVGLLRAGDALFPAPARVVEARDVLLCLVQDDEAAHAVHEALRGGGPHNP